MSVNGHGISVFSFSGPSGHRRWTRLLEAAKTTSGSFRGIVSTYQKYSFEPEMRKALDRWGQYVDNLPRTIIARPAEAVRSAETAGLSELEAADNRELEAA